MGIVVPLIENLVHLRTPRGRSSAGVPARVVRPLAARLSPCRAAVGCGSR